VNPCDLVRNVRNTSFQAFSGIVGDWCGIVLEFGKPNSTTHPFIPWYRLRVLLSSHRNQVVESWITVDELKENFEVLT
jgi:hypothetical protein